MSDITIPGFSNQNSSIDTQQVIEDLLELERIPLARIESSIDGYEQERAAWRDIGRGITQLADNANFLYSFQNPFNERQGISGNENALTLTAERNTEESSHTIKIIQDAGADAFLSQEIDRNYRVPPGTYTFAIGPEEVSIDFNGGSLRSFANRINNKNPELLTARVVQKSDSADTILFQSQVYGEENRLRFRDDALTFAQEHGVVAYTEVQKFQSESEYIISPQEEERVDLREAIEIDDEQSRLSFRALVQDIDPSEDERFALPSSGDVTIADVTVPNLSSAFPLSDNEEVTIDNTHRTFVYGELNDGSEIALAEIEASEEAEEIELSLPNFDSSLEALILRNDNTHQRITISELAINAESEDEYRPLNAIDEARDAILELDGIEVTRAENTIDDLLPGVTLNILDSESEEIEIEITPDYDVVKDAIIGFVGSYNQLIRELNILARNDPELINEIEFFTPEEREAAQARLGLMQGETTLTQLRTRLINYTQNPYPTSAGREVNLLSQIGIATNVGGFNSGALNPSRLRGYLEFDESQFDAVLRDKFEAIKELFGNDTDGDLVVDSGIAHQIDTYSDLYIQNGGVVQIRTEGLDNRIERSNEQLTTYNERLENYERKLRSDFGQMQGALNSLDDTTRALDNLQNQQ